MTNVIPFTPKSAKAKPAAKVCLIEEISDTDINGMVLIEACVPRAVLTRFAETLTAEGYEMRVHCFASPETDHAD